MKVRGSVPLSLFASNTDLKISPARWVAWVDAMGTKQRMEMHPKAPAGDLFKIHEAAVRYKSKAVTLYPVMDGFYVTSNFIDQFKSFLISVLESIIDHNCKFQRGLGWIILRGGISRGDIVEGKEQEINVCRRLFETNREYANRIVSGKAIIRAFNAERNAPPFGFSIDPEIASNQDNPFATQTLVEESSHMWKWHENSDYIRDNRSEFLKKLNEYYCWCEGESERINYPIDKIREHQSLAHKYFSK